jgi:hypothetical protein
MSSELRAVAAWSLGESRGVRQPRRTAVVFATLMLVAAMAAVACGPAATPTQPLYTEVPIGATAWPGGTTGQYGLHVDPTLLSRLPSTVDAYAIVEDPGIEAQAMDDPNVAKVFDRYSAAKIGDIFEPNWISLVIGHFSAASGSDAYAVAYTTWVDDYAAAACSQADGVASVSQETINFWNVDEAHCGGGPVVYTLSLQNGVILSIVGLGPLDLGRKLIDSLYS